MHRRISMFEPDDDLNSAPLWCEEPGASMAALVARIRRASVRELEVIHRAVGERLTEVKREANRECVAVQADPRATLRSEQRMAEVLVQATSRSRWRVAKVMMEAYLDRVGLRVPSGAWPETNEGLRIEGSPAMCEAIAGALESLGLGVEVHEANPN